MKTTQRQKVEHLLRANGARGVHTFELRQAFIGNPSERIGELERDNWQIQHTREKLNGGAYGTRYVLLAEPDDVGGGSGPSGPSPRPLPAATSSAVEAVKAAVAQEDWAAAEQRLFEAGKPERPHWQDAA